jgi:hypothetical protein
VGGLTLSAGSLVDFEIGWDSDLIHVNGGNVFLDGTLRVSLLDGYAPLEGESFAVFDGSWAALSGAFQQLQLPSLGGGLAWNISQLNTAGILSVESAAASGDFNGDGSVDGMDLAAWQAGFGATPGMLGDADGDADSDGADFLIWQRSLTGAEHVAVDVVPEPGSAALALLALTLMSGRATLKRRC